MNKWELKIVGETNPDLQTHLQNGWEPFALKGYAVYLKRKTRTTQRLRNKIKDART